MPSLLSSMEQYLRSGPFPFLQYDNVSSPLSELSFSFLTILVLVALGKGLSEYHLQQTLSYCMAHHWKVSFRASTSHTVDKLLLATEDHLQSLSKHEDHDAFYTSPSLSSHRPQHRHARYWKLLLQHRPGQSIVFIRPQAQRHSCRLFIRNRIRDSEEFTRISYCASKLLNMGEFWQRPIQLFC